MQADHTNHISMYGHNFVGILLPDFANRIIQFLL